MNPWIPVLALVIACLAVMADAVSTREALRHRNLYERNKLRAFLIRTLGMNGGTYGVSLAVCGALVYSYGSSMAAPTKVLCYLMVFCASVYVTRTNYTKGH